MKKVISLALALVMMLSVTAGLSFSVQAAGEVKTGQCGTNATYTFDTETGVLTISGTGRITSYYFNLHKEIKKLVINEGITRIGECAFCSTGIEELVLPDGMTDIEPEAFDETPYMLDSKNAADDGVIYNNNYVLGVKHEWYDYGEIPADKVNLKIKKGTVLVAAEAFTTVKYKTIVIPNTVKYINRRGFNEIGADSITIPTSVTHIYADSFTDNCSVDVYYKGSRSDVAKIRVKNPYTKRWAAYGKTTLKPLFGGEEVESYAEFHYAKVSAPVVTSLKKIKKGFTIRWKKRTGAKGYQVQYATNKAMTKGKKLSTVKGNKTFKKTVRNLKGKKAYYVRMRSYKLKNGKKVYSSWSDVKKITTK